MCKYQYLPSCIAAGTAISCFTGLSTTHHCKTWRRPRAISRRRCSPHKFTIWPHMACTTTLQPLSPLCTVDAQATSSGIRENLGLDCSLFSSSYLPCWPEDAHQCPTVHGPAALHIADRDMYASPSGAALAQFLLAPHLSLSWDGTFHHVLVATALGVWRRDFPAGHTRRDSRMA